MQNKNWTYSNRRHYWGYLLFRIVFLVGSQGFVFFMLIEVFSMGLQRHFSAQYDIVIPLIIMAEILLVLLNFWWVWRMRFNNLNPSFRMNEEMMEIDRAKKVRFDWEDVKEIVVTDKVELVGLLYNIERQAIIFKLSENKQEFMIIGKGIYIYDFERFYSLIQEYVPSAKITYKNLKPLAEYRDWLKTW